MILVAIVSGFLVLYGCGFFRPSGTEKMSEEEYRQYFCTKIMGMEL